ncbi:nuclear transport factor 2 family protein [Lysobacter sp. D1-1-M9]|uniref:nuclear transport factor 2 family protein n=1 Tax=Novilysobacter longmucuonensis TaxID=3098603 RepID=UPI002FC5F745
MLLSLLLGCSRTPPEQQLRESLGQLQAVLEGRDASAMSEWLAEDFVGPDGMDRDAARRLARVMFLRHRDVGVTLGPLDVALQEGHATVRFTAAVSGGSGRILPDSARVYEVETGWRMVNGEWRMTSVRW